MASRWRIRHKLMLGLGLVVCIMALLLLGTSRGLWSYYVTTNSIRARLAELLAAEEFKSAVFELTNPENVVDLVDNHQQLPEDVKKARDALTAYEDQIEESLAGTQDPRRGIFEKELIQRLREDIEKFQTAVMSRVKPSAVPNGPGMKEQHLAALAEPISNLRRDTLDLRDHLKEELGIRLGESRSHYQVALWIIIPSSLVGLVVMASLMRSFYAWVFNPIHDLEQGVCRVAQGDLQHRIDLHSGDEMEDLAKAFNSMLGRLCELYSDLAKQVNERSRQLVRSERLASVGFLAAGVAHEINNPLASIAFCSEALESRLADLLQNHHDADRERDEHTVFHKYLKMIQQEAFRCKNITERLLEFSRTGEPKRESTDLRGLVQAVLDITQHLPNHKGKKILFEVPPERKFGRIAACVNAEEIKSVILNLVVNALENMDEDGRLTIRLNQKDGMAELRFIDTGIGMSQEILDNIFEPFFTRNRSGKGTGLGLTISHLIISQHGGEIEATSPGPGQGSTFTVRLPVFAQAAVGLVPTADDSLPVMMRAA